MPILVTGADIQARSCDAGPSRIALDAYLLRMEEDLESGAGIGDPKRFREWGYFSLIRSAGLAGQRQYSALHRFINQLIYVGVDGYLLAETATAVDAYVDVI